MRAIVLGAGVIGVTSAWYLHKAGYDVTVIERNPQAAEGTSFANAGQLSYGYAMPWAAPGVPLKALKWLADPQAPFKLKLDKQQPLQQAIWLAKMWANCTPGAFERNKSRMLALSSYSRQAMQELQSELSLSFDYQSRGTLQVFRTLEQVRAAQRDLRILQEAGVQAHATGKDELLSLEPGLKHSKVELAGGLHLPRDGTGDCHQFTQSLARAATAAGVKFMYDMDAFELWRNDAGVVVGVITPKAWFTADVIVLAMGCDTPALAKQVGLSLPVYPIKGYSLTYDVTNSGRAPFSTLMDETYKVAITRLGNRVRVGGTAEVCGFDRQLRPERRAVLAKSVTDLFPDAGNPEEAQFWTGLRPSTPDSVPYLGPTSVKGLWVNCGHGTLGWTMACGSGKALAELVKGNTHAVPPEVVKPLG